MTIKDKTKIFRVVNKMPSSLSLLSFRSSCNVILLVCILLVTKGYIYASAIAISKNHQSQPLDSSSSTTETITNVNEHENTTILYNALCPSGMFQCANGKCISSFSVCNYQKDCEDGEDELQSCLPPQCKIGQIHCDSDKYAFNKPYCYQVYKYCDWTADCENGSDERNCIYRTCHSDYIFCNAEESATLVNGSMAGPCVYPHKRCDGYFDCRNGKDEEGCSGVSCRLDQFRCADGTGCIDYSLKCNHKNDCEDKSDEDFCNFPPCKEDQFRCTNGFCIPNTFHCNGYYDCDDESDERNCTAIPCPHNNFLCARGGPNNTPKCIPQTQLCDGKPDCEDGSDEETTCSMESCSTLKCEHKCSPSLTGGVCFCLPGQALGKDNRTCTDIDECTEWGHCEQLCTNSDGSYSCACVEGYKLEKSSKCVASNAVSPELIFAHDRQIVRISSKGQDSRVIINGPNASGIAFHYEKNLLFWADIKAMKVHSQPLDDDNDGKKNTVDIYLPRIWAPASLAVDWIGDKLYVADMIGEKIDVFELNFRWHAIVISSNLTSPVDLALDPTFGLMFIANSNNLLRADMDGTNMRAIESEETYKISGVTVDLIVKRIFWCDSVLGHIGTVHYDGNNRVIILRGHQALSPSRLVLFENWIFWTDVIKQAIISIDKFNGSSSIQQVYKAQNIQEPIIAIHPLVQPKVSNPCGNNNGGCEHLCILTARKGTPSDIGFRCACHIGWQLSDDMRNCHIIQEFLLYSEQKRIRGKILDPTADSFNDAILPAVSERARFIGLDFDSHDQYIYYSDVENNAIYRVDRNGSDLETLQSGRESVESIAVDWISKNLYFVTGKKGTLNVLSIQNFTYHRTLLKNLKKPRALVVHPNRGYIFFSEWESSANITRANSDGTNLLVFKNVFVLWPNGLTIDFKTDRIYWCDALFKRIQHATLDGKDIKTLNSPLILHPFSIAVHEDWIYFTDWKLDAIIRLDKLTGKKEEIILCDPISDRFHARFYDLKVYSSSLQDVNLNHPCLENNGGCEKFCFAVPKNGSTELHVNCSCPDREKLTDDKRTCIADPNAEPLPPPCPYKWQFTCKNKRCIHYSVVCDGGDDCLDNSDEHCGRPTCGSDEFKCASNLCIPMSYRCDRKNDCGDYSDEFDCGNCGAGQFNCTNHYCIPVSWKCDGENDCGDGSDEADFCPPRACPPSQYICLTNGRCISKYFVCDGNNDCEDGQDEKDCPPIECLPNQFKCANQLQCKPEFVKCDGDLDCTDGSDEQGCPINCSNWAFSDHEDCIYKD